MKKKFNVCGVGQAIVDILLEVGEQEFQALGFPKLSYELVDAVNQRKLLERFSSHAASMVSGGSVANSVVGVAQLGGSTGLITHVGDDRYGLHFTQELGALSVALAHQPRVGGITGTCAVLVTPDAQRTMRTCLGVAAELGSTDIDAEMIAASEWVFAEGYLLLNGERGAGAIESAFDFAAKSGTRTALTCSDAFVIGSCRSAMERVVDKCDLLFANEHEAQALTGKSDTAAAFEVLRNRVPNVVVTAGPEGAFVWLDQREYRVAAFPCEPRDLTGAGDMFAGAFLYGITHGLDGGRAARAACFMAMQVIIRVGARLHSGVREYWQEATRAN